MSIYLSPNTNVNFCAVYGD